ncbi:MAG: 4-hydroxy-3-methylbut-2-enyl diphosphate reductase [Betaproteobacteria bacterium]|nr:4-hydroxy-3-methylbut-2-enyl diphosphate reductase [Betaproteobacteria bacterium]
MDKKIISISLANPRGFCAGVDRAIEIVEQALAKYGSPIYVRNEVVHNKFVIEALKKKGAIFVNDLKSVPENSYLIYSAHGVSKKVKSDSDNLKLKSIDATCPLVTKVHKEVNHYLKNNYEIIMIGHKGHPEVEGTLGQDLTSKKMHLIENISDIDLLKISDPNKVAYVTQTTLSLDETKDIIEKLKTKFSMIEGPKADDICYATQNRQDAIKQILPSADILFVVGSKNSSNSNRLKELGEKKGIPSILIDDMSDFNPAWLDDKKNIAITAGASAPEVLIKQLTKLIQSHSNAIINEIDGPKENIVFKLPVI